MQTQEERKNDYYRGENGAVLNLNIFLALPVDEAARDTFGQEWGYRVLSENEDGTVNLLFGRCDILVSAQVRDYEQGIEGSLFITTLQLTKSQLMEYFQDLARVFTTGGKAYGETIQDLLSSQPLL